MTAEDAEQRVSPGEVDLLNPPGEPPFSRTPPPSVDARADWFARVARRSTVEAPVREPALAPPSTLVAEAGQAQVTLRWRPVQGAIGYLLHRSPGPDGPWQLVDHRSGDLLCVPPGPYADTTLDDAGAPAWYAVSSLATVEAPTGPRSLAIEPAPIAAGLRGCVRIGVDALAVTGPLARPWRPMIGAERLSLLLRDTDGPGTDSTGTEVARALGMARQELGVESVRAHAIFHDELAVVRRESGRLVHDFTRVDAVYDRLLEIGLRPVIELSFMPAALAREPQRTVFDYRAIVSPPLDMAEWTALVTDLVTHLRVRYGAEEVARWAFEVWNEPNLEVFWAGSQHDYLELYAASARAVKAVDPRLRVGGPATAAAGWLGPFLDRLAREGMPVDFLSTHTYGNPPLDIAQAARASGLPDLPIWWTEWGVSPTHFAPVNDAVFGAPFICRSMKLAADLGIEALAYWVISDHFEELGAPPRLFHGGFGLLSVGNLRKPRYWALALLERLGPEALLADVSGDGAVSLVDAWASRHDDGRFSILAWNGTLDQRTVDGDPRLGRRVELTVSGLPASRYRLAHYRVDADHSNIVAAWARLGGQRDWPSTEEWAELRSRDRLDPLISDADLATDDGRLEITFDLPMPAVSFLELVPLPASR